MSSSVDKVMQFVERELAKDPGVSNEKLFEGAKKLSRAVGKLSPRQFHAKYPLQVKRRKKNGKGRKRASASPRRAVMASRSNGRAKESPEAVRKVMLRFAQDLSAAGNQSETIGVLANLDRYVTDIMKATRN